MVAEHRVIVEKAIGRHLTTKEVVHHIDANKSNNELGNLFLCKSELEHRKAHKVDPVFLRMFNLARYQQWESFKDFDVTKNRQDQLQEIILKDHSGVSLVWNINKFCLDNPHYINVHWSAEVVWLVFVMLGIQK